MALLSTKSSLYSETNFLSYLHQQLRIEKILYILKE